MTDHLLPVAASSEDYKLLEDMHTATASKFCELTKQSEEISKGMASLQASGRAIHSIRHTVAHAWMRLRVAPMAVSHCHDHTVGQSRCVQCHHTMCIRVYRKRNRHDHVCVRLVLLHVWRRGAEGACTCVQGKAKELQPRLDQIDVLDASTSELVNTAQMLDDYAKRLGENAESP